MYIKIPSELRPLPAVNFARFLSGCNESSVFTYDFKDMQHCHPYGLLVLASAIRNNMKKYARAKHEVINPMETQGGQFAASFGFYQSIGFDIGEAKEETDIGDNYIPIKKITAKDLHAKYSGSTLLNDKVQRYSGELADTLVPDKPTAVKEALQYCFREIIRNTFEHAKTEELWVCGQFWPSRNEAEIAILDEGIGIFQSLQNNRRIQAKNCTSANLLALQPGLSRTLGCVSDPDDTWQNSGYGLYVASTVSALCDGYFILNSGDSAVLVSKEGQTQYNSYQLGTAICLNLHTDGSKIAHFAETLQAIVDEGQQIAGKNSDQRILTASKTTTTASMLRHISSAIDVKVDPIITFLGEAMIPLNACAWFTAEGAYANGDVSGTFVYNEKTYPGLLLNVSAINRKKYIENQVKIPVVVRKTRGNKYTLMEKHKFDKTHRNMKP